MRTIETTQEVDTVTVMAKRKKLGADLSPELVDEFSAWCDTNGFSKGKASAAAIRLFMLLHESVRLAVLRGEWQVVQTAAEQAGVVLLRQQLEEGLAQTEQQLKRRPRGPRG